jgi:serine phosphatase RsbU (regulator of sigma subunit)
VGNATFSTSTFHLAVGDRLTLYTDGLLEARNRARELYGFERVRELIATRPDATMASDAAVHFGQEDDITVLTISRLATGVESTTSLSAPVLVATVA